MLNIYKASAGAGKTFTLVLEYFKLILTQRDGYKNSLAVTFTNKATEEMKLRIVEELYVLAQGDGNSKYESTLLNSKELHDANITTKEALYSKAKVLLKAILHDYSKLSVSTIDQFFQRLMRSFLRELKKSPSYSVELETDAVLEAAVGRVIERIPNEPSLAKWVRSFIDISLDKASKVRVEEALVSIGKELFNEQTMELEDVLFRYETDDIDSLYNQLNDEIEKYKCDYSAICDKALNLLDSYGMDYTYIKYGKLGPGTVFLNGSQNGKYVSNYADFSKRFVDFTESESWVDSKNCGGNHLLASEISEKLSNVANELIDLVAHGGGERYATNRALISNLYNLGILKTISEEMANVCRENDVMMLHDTTKLLNTLIANNDTSFIYEKMGNYYNNIMIDEFQDTSRMQWSNFKPLVANSISQEGGNSLIVGDIKQSIYKFRNGDWRMLAYGVQSEFAHMPVLETTLKKNWRSYRNVVEFNNCFFPVAADIVRADYDQKCGTTLSDSRWVDSVTTAYREGVQEIDKSEEGLVEIRFINKGKDVEKEDAQNNLLQGVVNILEELHKVSEWSDCSILVNTSKEGAVLASTLLSNGIPFISSKTLLISESPSIQFLIALLRYFRMNSDMPNRATILSCFYKLRGEVCPEDIFFNCGNATSLKELLDVDFDIDEVAVSSMSLYDKVDFLIERFALNKIDNEINYLITFQDLVYNYVARSTDSLSEFIEAWDRTLRDTSITLSDNIDAVRIMTIHKSKGLEFKHVILPFFDWELDSTSGNIWVNTSSISDKIEYIPVNCTASLLNTMFSNEYKDELCREMVDRLNVMYVAMTRPIKSLHICSCLSLDSKLSCEHSNMLLYKVISGTEGNFSFLWDKKNEDFDNGDIYYRRGSLSKKIEDSDTKSSELKEFSISSLVAYSSADKFVIKSTYDDFAQEETPRTKAIDEGKLLHFIMQNIDCETDVEKGVYEAVSRGLLSVIESDRYILMIKEYLLQVSDRGWFSANTKSVRERDIIRADKEVIRPDRVLFSDNEIVVIDFKFGAENNDYMEKVNEYCAAISAMGYSQSVKGYLWYPKIGKIVALD
ncbi:MAG: UvrD-helicase domain-containing protein [Marinifilaceae bacterium]|nr:UvrD-helicase domain-containing protein [Marinifilaceae bacterium]